MRPRWRSVGRRRSTAHLLAGRSAAEDGSQATLLFREECRRSRQGKKVDRRHCGLGCRGAAGLRPDQAIEEALRCARSGGDLIGRTWRPLRPPKTPARRSERRLSTTDAGTAHLADRNTPARSVHPAALSDRRVRCPFASASRAGRSAPQKPGSRHHPIIVQHHEGTERHSFPGPAPASMAFRP